MKEEYLVIFKILRQLPGKQTNNPGLQREERDIGEYNPVTNQIIFLDIKGNEILLVVGLDCEIIEKI